MIKLTHISILFLLVSCLNTPKKKQQPVVIKTNVTENIIEKEVDTTLIETETEVYTANESDCIFDQTTQTDEFLKGIIELENYKWNAEEKVATVILDSNDTLLISRGGCNHFGVSAEFRLRNDTIDYSNWENVYKRVLWISELLSFEFAFEEIKNELNSSDLRTDNDYTYFSNEYLQDNNYELYRKVETDKSIIILSYYLN